MSDHPKQDDATSSPPPRDPPGKLSPDEQRAHMRAIQEANATGNHESRNHPVRVPTKAGEPVRG